MEGWGHNVMDVFSTTALIKNGEDGKCSVYVATIEKILN